jgi:hypothetical protein
MFVVSWSSPATVLFATARTALQFPDVQLSVAVWFVQRLTVLVAGCDSQSGPRDRQSKGCVAGGVGGNSRAGVLQQGEGASKPG